MFAFGAKSKEKMLDNNKRSALAIKGEDGDDGKRRKYTLDEYVQMSANDKESQVSLLSTVDC